MNNKSAVGILALAASISFAQPKLSMQAYGQYGVEDKDNLYKTIGIEGFVESGRFFYAGSLGYLDATLNMADRSSMPAVYSGIHVIENVNSSIFATSKRYTAGNRLEYFHPSGFNAALTASFAYETADYRSIYAYTYEPRPFPVGWDTTLNYSLRQTARYLTAGLELSRFYDLDKFGAGALYVTDFHDVKRVQPYVFFVSNIYQRIVARVTPGAVITGGTVNPYAKGIVSWQATVDLKLQGSLLYSRTTFIYDVFDRFLSFYREKNELQGGLLVLYGLSSGIDFFSGIKYERNDRFDMWIMTVGTYIHP